MDGERKRWWPAVVGAVAVMSVLLAVRWRGTANPLPNAITDQPAARTAERPLYPLQRQPTILQADAAAAPLGASTAVSPLPAAPATSPAAAEPWPRFREDAPREPYHSAALDYLPIPASHDQQRP